MYQRPSSVQYQQPKENFESQLQKIINQSIQHTPIQDNFFSWQDKRAALEQLIKKNISKYNFDDSSDEDDIYVETPKELIKKLNKQVGINESNYSIILELEGRRILYSRYVKDRYKVKKQTHLKSDSTTFNAYLNITSQIIQDFFTSIQKASINFIGSLRPLIKFELNQEDNIILQEFLSILYSNLITCVTGNMRDCKKWLRNLSRIKKNDSVEIPEWIIEIQERCIAQFFQNFKNFIETNTKRKISDQKYQFEFAKNLIIKLENSYNGMPIQQYMIQNLGDMIQGTIDIENFISQKQKNVNVDNLAKIFLQQNSYIFNFNKVQSIFQIIQQQIFKKCFTQKSNFTRIILSKQYYNPQDINGMVELYSEMNLIKRSILRLSHNGQNEIIHSLVFYKKQDIVVQIIYTIQKQPRRVFYRILDFSQDNLMQAYQQIQIQGSQLAGLIRNVFVFGFIKNQEINHLNKQQKQLLANFMVYFMCIIGHHSPASMILINMLLDLIQYGILKFEHLFHQKPNESQTENWLSQQVNLISVRQHHTLPHTNLKVGDEISDFFLKRSYIVQTWVEFQKMEKKFKCICQEDLLRKFIKLNEEEWFGFQV